MAATESRRRTHVTVDRREDVLNDLHEELT
jgi:hypothetical protein